MAKTINIRVAKELQEELDRIQRDMKKKIADFDITKNQASKIAARRLMEWRVKGNKT